MTLSSARDSLFNELRRTLSRCRTAYPGSPQHRKLCRTARQLQRRLARVTA